MKARRLDAELATTFRYAALRFSIIGGNMKRLKKILIVKAGLLCPETAGDFCHFVAEMRDRQVSPAATSVFI